MPSQTLNQELAALPIIEFSKVARGDPGELSALLSAFKDGRFAYLDLSGAKTGHLWERAEEVMSLSSEFFDQALEDKLEYHIDKIDMSGSSGYKPAGLNSGVIEGGRDGWEGLKIPRDGFFNIHPDSAYTAPGMVAQNRPVFEDFMSTCHKVCMKILSALSTALQLAEDERFELWHDQPGARTNTVSILLHYPPRSTHDNDIGQTAHTDSGSVSLVFAPEWGLQMWSPETRNWVFVRPKPGHAIVGVADSLTFLSKEQLPSAIHRVILHESCIGRSRYSCGYFLRPDRGSVFTDASGNKRTAEDWTELKYTIFSQPPEMQKLNSILTGKAGFVGSWEGFKEGTADARPKAIMLHK